ncbi:MAG: hypothetical protein WAQ07_01000 [Candidatus Omnitrophota bacterium]
MKNSRFVTNAGNIDNDELRLRRKEVLGYSIFALLFAILPKTLIEKAGGYSVFTVMHIIAVIILIFVIIAFIGGIKALYKLTKIIYVNPKRYFIAYLFLIFLGGFVIGFFAILGLILLWIEVRKFINRDKLNINDKR